MIQHFILATAGHVDHGKSSLIKALTGTDPDRLPEEKARGITIDLGFAHLSLQSPRDPAHAFQVGIVDVPGHEDFVKNMVAGVGSIDVALMVVAADDGWMPQTEEHLQILSYLGISRGVIALTKIDLAEAREREAVGEVREKLRGTAFQDAPIVPVSTLSGRGVEEIKAALATVLVQGPIPPDFGKPRLPVDRVFVLRGIGTVATGTLSGGSLQRGQPAVIQPAGRPARIRNLQTHNADVACSAPGTRTAVNLPDVTIADKSSMAAANEGIRRGEVITLPELGAACDTLDVLIEKSPRLAGTQQPAARPLKDGAQVRVHHGTGNFPARLFFLDQKQLAPGERALAQLRFEQPVFAFLGDHFIIRDFAEQATLAGGRVLDPDARRRTFRSERQKRFLQQRAEAAGDVSTAFRTLLERDGVVKRGSVLLKAPFPAAEISETMARLAREAQAVLHGELVAHPETWRRLKTLAAEAIHREHREHPERIGLPLSQLRPVIEAEHSLAELFDGLIADLLRGGFIQTGTLIKHASHRPALPPNLQSAGARLRAALSAKPFEPPSRKELAPDNTAQQALRFLRDTGEVVELSDELVLSAESFVRMKEMVSKFIRERGPATVSDLRQMLGTTRRVIMPLLERLDREGITVRQGDVRALRGR
jgi:selenocysteine-specific elongation factor